MQESMSFGDQPKVSHLPLKGANVSYYPNWLDASKASSMQDWLKSALAWRQDTIKLYGKPVKIPRLQAWYGDPHCVYQYSNLLLNPLPWNKPLLSLKRRCERQTQTQFNSVLVNWYRDGQDSMGLHADDEPELGRQPTIASVTLGQSRPFVLKNRKTGERTVLNLAHGSLLVMAGDTQSNYLHGIAKTTKSIGDRINLTFRNIYDLTHSQ